MTPTLEASKGKEALGEGGKEKSPHAGVAWTREEFRALDGNVPYDAKKSIGGVIDQLVAKFALDDRHKQSLASVLKQAITKDSRAQAKLEQTTTVWLSEGKFVLENKDGIPLWTEDLTDQFHSYGAAFDAWCSARRRTRVRTRIELAAISSPQAIIDYYRLRRYPNPEKKAQDHLKGGPELTEAEKQDMEREQARIKADALDFSRRRESLVRNLLETHEKEYNPESKLDASFEPWVEWRLGERNNWHQHFHDEWIFVEGRKQVEDMLVEDPENPEQMPPAAGYKFNPFRQFNWTVNDLPYVISDSLSVNFEDVADRLYGDNKEAFISYLATKGIPEPLFMIIRDRGKNFVEAVKEVSKLLKDVKLAREAKKNGDTDKYEDLSEKYWSFDEEFFDELVKDSGKLELLDHIMGDFSAYIGRLVTECEHLKYRPHPTERPDLSSEQQNRFRRDGHYGHNVRMPDGTMLTKWEVPEGASIIDDKPVTDTKNVLGRFFVEGVENASVYYEGVEWLFDDGARHRDISMRDIYGRTYSLNEDSFTKLMSKEAAYAHIYSAGRRTERDRVTGVTREVFDQEAVIRKLNSVLAVGMTTYFSTPEHSILEEAMEDMGLQFTTEYDVNIGRIYDKLRIKPDNIQALLNETDTEVEMWRKRFIRIGTVVDYHAEARQRREQALAMQEAYRAEKSLRVELKPDQINGIIEEMKTKADPPIAQGELDRIKSYLIGGLLVIPTGPAPGAALQGNIPLGNGWSVSIAVGHFSEAGNMAGFSVGKTFQATDQINISLQAGAGYMFREGGAGTVGGAISGTLSYSFDSWTAHVTGGAILPLGPMGSVGASRNMRHKFEAAWEKKQDGMELTETNFKGDIEKIMKDSGLTIDAPSLDYVYREANRIVLEEQRGEAVDESWALFKGAEAGVIGIPAGGMVIPFGFIEIGVPGRVVLFRIENTPGMDLISDAAVTHAAIQEAKEIYRQKNGQVADIEIAKEPIKLASAEVMVSEEGRLGIKRTRDLTIPFEKLDSSAAMLGEFEEEVETNYDIELARPNAEGLIELDVLQTNGVIEMYLDPEMKDTFLVCDPASGRAYLSVPKGYERPLVLRREDIRSPYEDNAFIERTIISITDNPRFRRTGIGGLERAGTRRMEKLTGSSWDIRRDNRRESGGTVQGNIMTLEQYRAWLAGSPADGSGEHSSERLTGMDSATAAAKTEAWNSLTNRLSVSGAAETASLGMRPDLAANILGLRANNAFMLEFRRLTTDAFTTKKDRRTDWAPDIPALVKLINDTMPGDPVNALELDLILFQLTVGSFMSIESERKRLGLRTTQDAYIYYLERFQEPMLAAIFEGHPDAAQMVKLVSDHMRGINIEEAKKTPFKMEKGMLFGTIVGTKGITGLRRLINYGNDKEYSILGAKQYSLTAGYPKKKPEDPESPERLVALFWLNYLSEFASSAALADILKTETIEANKEKILAQMHTPLALKLAPALAATMSASEMGLLERAYGGEITAETLPVVTKLLNDVAKVREKQIEGAPWVQLGVNFKLHIKTNIHVGAYERCTNISGVLDEQFVLEYLPTGKKVNVIGGRIRVMRTVILGHERRDVSFNAGLAFPIRIGTERVEPPREPGEKPPEVPPEEPPVVPPEEPPVVPPEEPEPTPHTCISGSAKGPCSS